MRFIGSKNLLLENINNVIEENIKSADVFCDIFSGTTAVANYFKKDYKIISNDLLYFSYVIQKATIENNIILKFNNIPKISNPIEFFNSLTDSELEKIPINKRFFQNNYSSIGNRMYLTENNALRIDYARNKVEEWYNKGYISRNEYYYLVASIVEGIPFVSNISGTYGAYHKKWDKRAFKKFELKPLIVINNKRKNKCYNIDGIKLLDKISGDILYIDPPYNERQYLPNYHLLETAAKYDSPIIKGVTGQREYTEKEKSNFCNKTKAIVALEEMIRKAKFKHIILSYSNEGIMKIEDIEHIMKKYGIIKTYKLYTIPYRRFKSHDQKNKKELSELLFYIKKDV